MRHGDRLAEITALRAAKRGSAADVDGIEAPEALRTAVPGQFIHARIVSPSTFSPRKLSTAPASCLAARRGDRPTLAG